MSMRYEDRPQAENKILGETTFTYKTLGTSIGRIVRSEQYATGKFRVVEFYDTDNRLIMKSELQGTAPTYEYRVETYYTPSGIVAYTVTYHREYDSSNILVSEGVL